MCCVLVSSEYEYQFAAPVCANLTITKKLCFPQALKGDLEEYVVKHFTLRPCLQAGRVTLVLGLP